MGWRKRDLWKSGIVVAGVLLLLLLMMGIPLSAASAYEEPSGSATPGTVTVQVTATEDATVTALNKEKLAQEVQQLKSQNEPDLLGWLRTNASILLSTIVVVAGVLVGLLRWLGDRHDEQEKRREDQQSEQEKRREDQQSEQEKRAEERFQKVVEGLGGDNEGAKVGAAILLRTFLRPGYEQFYAQTFDLAVAHLRLRQTSPSSPEEEPDNPLPLTTLSQALIVAFKEAFPRARSQNKGGSQSLDATGIQLDLAYLEDADLDKVWMPQASLRKAKLSRANLSEAFLVGADLSKADLSKAVLNKAALFGTTLSEANLSEANLSGTFLGKADLSGADLSKADLGEAFLSMAYLFLVILSGANLSGANLSGADLRGANLSGANLSGANLSGANLTGVDLSGDDLRGANLSGADLRGANLSGANLTGANIEDARSLQDTSLRIATGLTKDQKAACKAKGAIIDEDPTASSSQLTVAPSSPPQSNSAQASWTSFSQGSLPSPDTGGGSAVASKPDSES
jgi:uncharacterized protein YjbI with pentapeptide repeats